MRHTYYWYFTAEARLPWSLRERHLIFSPPSSLSMGPSVVENEFSLICMTDKHILYLSHRRSYAMDLGTREREESGGEMMRGLTSMNEVNGVYVCVWVSMGAWICACVCIMHWLVMFMYALLFIPMPFSLFSCGSFWIYISMCLFVCTHHHKCMHFVCKCIYSHISLRVLCSREILLFWVLDLRMSTFLQSNYNLASPTSSRATFGFCIRA